MIVLSGADEVSKEIARGIARALNVERYEIVEKIFPDGEIYVRLPEEVVGVEDLVFVQSFIPPQDRSILKTMLVLDTLREKRVKKIRVVVPYLAYSRQDKEFLPNEAVSVRTVLRTLRMLGAEEFYTIEIHKKDSLRFFEGKALSLSPYTYMARFLDVKDSLLILAPDLGALERAKVLADALGVEYDYLVKERDRVTGAISMKPKSLKVKDKNVIIVDDIISTGGTVAKATEMLLSQGANSVTVMVAHALMVGNASEKLRKAGVRKVYACNTLPRLDDDLIIYVDVSPVIADALRG